MSFVPQAQYHLATAAAAGGASWWKLAGALLVVFALLILFLKVLGRLQRGGASGDVSLLRVHALGPRRGVELLRCGSTVYTLYRNDQSMVLLSEEAFDPAKHETDKQAPGVLGLLGRRKPRSSG